MDNTYYLNHSYEGKESIYGSIFMDYRVSDMEVDNLILFGHNMKDGSMFGGLKKYSDKDY